MTSPLRHPQLRALPGGLDASAPSGRRSEERPSDEAIVHALEIHDPRIAGVLYDRVLPAIDRALHRVFGRREVDHEDLVQATFEQIIKTIAKRRYAGACSLPTWASSIATHVGLNALRSRRRERRVFDHDGETHEASPHAAGSEPRAHARLAMEQVRQELAAMSAERGEAVFLHDVLGHELAEIAVITGVSVAAAQSRLVRGRKELMERLDRAESAS